MKGFTREEFIEHLASKTKDWVLIGDYKNSLARTEFKHIPCGHTYIKTPYNVTSKPRMCKFCNANRLRGEVEFRERVKDKTDYEILGEYKNNRTKILVRHKKCGKTFETVPYNFLKTDEGCPHCVGDTIAKAVAWTNEKFLSEIGERKDEYAFLEEYKNFATPIKVKHLVCGEAFRVSPSNFLRGSRCPSCKYSTGEGQVFRMLKTQFPDEDMQHGNRKILPHGRELDIWLPNHNLAIEYDGLAFHSVKGLLRSHPKWSEPEAANYQKWKTDECEKLGIRLIHIFEDEWLEHPEIVEDKLRAILHAPMKRYYARKLQIKPVPREVADEFYEANHIQGKTNVSVSVGLYDGNELLALQSFLPYTRKKMDGAWELVRYATKLGVHIIGGFSKCLKWFEREHSPNAVVSFADRRWCDPFSNVYESSGFVNDGKAPKSYWYVKAPKRYHKASFRKDRIKVKFPKVYSPAKTEAQMMKEIGLQRIYDCGLIRYIKYYPSLSSLQATQSDKSIPNAPSNTPSTKSSKSLSSSASPSQTS